MQTHSVQISSLREKLASAQFIYLLEYELPPKNDSLAMVYQNINDICQYVKNNTNIAAISLTDRTSALDSVDPLGLVPAVSSRSGKDPIVHLSGKGYNLESIKKRLETIFAKGANNILAVTGDWQASISEYVDAVDIILEVKKNWQSSFVGAAVNPYKYTVNDSYGQYLKMIRKLNAGADYIVTQVGWDMKKLQELLLFNRMREVNVPVIARFALITREDCHKLTNLSLHKGVSVSREFASQVQRELLSSPQFMVTQLKRLCLQIAGASLMGFSGVQICGLKSAAEVKTVMDTTAALLSEFGSFAEWLKEWKHFHHGIELMTAPYTFYMFSHLMELQTDYEARNELKLAEAFFTKPTFVQNLKNKMASVFSLEKKTGVGAKLLRSLLTGSGEETIHDLRKTQYISTHKCPKKLHHGPCGGSQLDGTCEAGREVCMHNLRISLAARNNELDQMENPYE